MKVKSFLYNSDYYLLIYLFSYSQYIYRSTTFKHDTVIL